MEHTTMTTIQEPAVTSFIPETALAALEKRLGQVNRQAAKLGVEPLRYELTGRVEHRQDKRREPMMFAGERIAHTLTFIEVSVYGEQPKLPGGWQLLGVVDHREAVAITKAVPGHELPAGQRDRGPVCDHCTTKRRRVDTFVLRAEDGRVVQVGRQCIADFLGAATADPARQLSWWIDVRDVLDFDEAEYWGCDGGVRARTMIDVEQVTLVSGAVIDHFGWVSKQRSRETDEAATAERILFLLFPPKFTSQRDPGYAEWKELKDAVELRATDALKREAKAAVAWAATKMEDTSDYLRNLAACAVSETVGVDKMGIVASLIASYRREQDRLVQADRKAKLGAASEHVGEAEQRLTMELTLLEKPRANEGMYGVTYRCEFSDANGNLFVWWASNDPTLEQNLGLSVGEAATLKATVKKHEEYKGVKRTVVNRLARA